MQAVHREPEHAAHHAADEVPDLRDVVPEEDPLRRLLADSRMPVCGAIALSALFFSFIHLNPAQMPHAFVIGLLLGWMYWRTGSILPGVAFHWANNSVAYVLYNLYPNPDMKVADLFGGSDHHALLAVIFSLLILVPALFQLHVWMWREDATKV